MQILNKILNDKIIPTINLILQGDVKTIVTVFVILFIVVFVFTVYIDIHNMLRETIETLYKEYLIISSKYMILPMFALIGLFIKQYPIELMNKYYLFVKLVCFFWSLLIIEYIITIIVYIVMIKKNRPLRPKIRK